MGLTGIRGAGSVVAALAVVVAGCGGADGDRYDVTLDVPGSDTGVVAWPVEVAMSAEDALVVEAAGEVRDDAGHFHVVVDDGCVEPGEPIPSDATHHHFGDGSTEARLPDVGPGEHELCLQVGDGAHTALDATDEVTITVGAVTETAWLAETDLRCRQLQSRFTPAFDDFEATWGDVLADGAGPDHPEADRMVADWYAATDEIVPVFRETLETIVALPAPASHAERVAEVADELDTSLAVVAELTADRDPAFLFDDAAFPLERLFRLLDTADLGECIG